MSTLKSNIKNIYKEVRTIISMKKEEFLQNLETEIKIAKLSPYTLRNYLDSNKKLLAFLKKEPKEIEQQDIKNFFSFSLIRTCRIVWVTP